MAEMIRHTGVLTNTGKNVVVAFMSLPEDPDYALVIDTDALPDSFNEALRKIVESVDGQNAQNLAEVLARRISPDGSNLTMLQKLHQAGRLTKVPVDIVNMTPRKGLNWPLRQILEAMKQQQPETPTDLNDLDPETRAQVISEMGKFNVHATNMEGTTAEGQKAEAANLLRMAQLLEADATAKREQAYKIDPSLKPKAKPKTVTHHVDVTSGSDLTAKVPSAAKTTTTATNPKVVKKAEAKKPANAKTGA